MLHENVNAIPFTFDLEVIDDIMDDQVRRMHPTRKQSSAIFSLGVISLSRIL